MHSLVYLACFMERSARREIMGSSGVPATRVSSFWISLGYTSSRMAFIPYPKLAMVALKF